MKQTVGVHWGWVSEVQLQGMEQWMLGGGRKGPAKVLKELACGICHQGALPPDTTAPEK
jgi:hypothetical protein